ncbi:hypothetical protein [Pleionea sp. CnH1-48]|uniref:hypothetical protein n=1 Tax=Pleionea sp. CnH1-48 TaxID=2954494 RepID=UPI002097296B|nr:hypothetical protein [Pleionea sp. CnH1-48]MCO7223684.1 hypothetical protein [Pleionea sp. CnH1-48]
MNDPEFSFEFMFQDEVVGLFSPFIPNNPGRVEFIPVRGASYDELEMEAEAGEMPECHFIRLRQEKTFNVFFDVISIPEYGVMMIDNLRETYKEET